MIPKFRAYLKMHKKIVDVQEINYKHEEIVWAGGKYIEVDYFKDIEILQSTGLFDKNGKEIFEGDIVIEMSYLNENYEPKKIVVAWDEWNCEFNVNHTFKYGIIGNKYQHPHLLEEE